MNAVSIVVAHRGVVTDTITENSLASLEEAIRRGYTHVEVDIRSTKDGRLVCLHDRSLRRVAGIRAYIDQLTLEDLRTHASELLVPTLETYCARAAGRIGLMPDVKDCPPKLREGLITGIEETLKKHGLMKNALFIGNSDIIQHFYGQARLKWRDTPEKLIESQPAGADLGKHFFAFGHGVDFDQEKVRQFQALGVAVVVSINTFHYIRGDPIPDGLRDVQRMRDLGVEGLQIDSVYDSAVFVSP